jgi:hypothetical protein
MDFGYPQNLSPEILKLYITQEGVRSPFSSKVKATIFISYQQSTPSSYIAMKTVLFKHLPVLFAHHVYLGALGSIFLPMV